MVINTGFTPFNVSIWGFHCWHCLIWPVCTDLIHCDLLVEYMFIHYDFIHRYLPQVQTRKDNLTIFLVSTNLLYTLQCSETLKPALLECQSEVTYSFHTLVDRRGHLGVRTLNECNIDYVLHCLYCWTHIQTFSQWLDKQHLHIISELGSSLSRLTF
jgi:hypothetical protein